KNGGPKEMLSPRLRVNENLDYRDHPEQRQCGQSRSQAEKEKYGKHEFVESREARCRLGIEQRNLVLVLKELNGEFPRPDLEQAGVEEYSPDADSHPELDDGQRESRKPFPCDHEPVANHPRGRPLHLMHGRHIGAPSFCLIETASPSLSS